MSCIVILSWYHRVMHCDPRFVPSCHVLPGIHVLWFHVLSCSCSWCTVGWFCMSSFQGTTLSRDDLSLQFESAVAWRCRAVYHMYNCVQCCVVSVLILLLLLLLCFVIANAVSALLGCCTVPRSSVPCAQGADLREYRVLRVLIGVSTVCSGCWLVWVSCAHHADWCEYCVQVEGAEGA
jgi:hypothetical protein